MKKILYTLLGLTLLQACSTSKRPHYESINKNWSQRQLPNDQQLSHSVYLIGETGNQPTLSPTLRLVQELAAKQANSSVVFLGNQVADGIPEEDDPALTIVQQSLKEQFLPFKNYQGNVFAIPGDKDWHGDRDDGQFHVQEQELFVEQLLGDKNAFVPDNGCGDPVDIELTDNLVLILLNTQWWLHQDAERDKNLDCEVRDEIDFLAATEEIILKHRGKKLLIAMHHPIYSSGKSGGYYPLKSHLFPLTAVKENLYIPLPVIGSIFPLSKKIIGSRQDISNPKQAAFKRGLLGLLHNQEGVILVSGHEPGMQYFFKKNHHFIVSGGGGREDYIKRGNSAEFSYQKNGFLKLNYFKNKEVWMEFWTPEDGGKLVFRKKLEDSPAPVFEEKDYQSIEKTHESAITTQASDIYNAKGFKKMWFGKHFRDEWAAEVTVPVVFLDTLKGGLTPIKKGGGFQTKSLRLKAANGKQYTLRTINKDVTKVVPPLLRGTFAQSIMQDGISASHPYGAFVIPSLADEVGIYHTQPQLMYVPPQSALGEFNDDFGDKLFLFEERPSGDWSDNPNFGNSKKIIGAVDLIKKLKKNNHSFVDQKYTVKARLFDIFIGDWDRHDDQWRWASFKDGKRTMYRPIPRDRDQVFYRFDGILPFIVARPFLTPQFRSFDEEIDYLPGLVFNARSFDRANLNQLTRADFVEAAKELQSKLTDEAIATAFESWPKSIYELNGADIIQKLKTRRANLVDIANTYYEFLAQTPDVVGTNEDEIFKVSRLGNGLIKVEVFDVDHKKERLVYSRIFDAKDTKEIRIYGQKGDDQFQIEGEVKESIKVIIIGGGGEDKVEDNSIVASGGKKTIVYDKPKGLTIAQDKGEVDNKAANEKGINKYNRFGYLYEKKIGFPLLAANPDEGIGLGYFTIIQKQGFRTHPYKSQHTIMGSFAFSTQSVNVNYRGHFPNTLGKGDFVLEAAGKGPSFITNYFGLGNEVPDTEEDLEFHRVRGTNISLHPAFYKDLKGGHSIQFGPTYEFYNLEQTEDRFVNTPEAALTSNTFDSRHYVGLDATYDYSIVDNPLLPLRGFRFLFGAEHRLNVNDTDFNFSRLHSDLAVYIPLNVQKSVLVATKLGAAFNFGDYEFFQANQLGGSSQVRGLNTGKFAGDGTFYHATDLRIALGRSKSVSFPFTFGVHGSFDYGRAWLEGEDSDQWHTSIGGGAYFIPLNLFVFRVSYFASDDDTILSIGANFSF